MVWMKTCPRCRGDLALDYDLDGPFIGCIQCGAVLSKEEAQSLVRTSLGVWRKQAISQPAT
jgi:hypothetical protein